MDHGERGVDLAFGKLLPPILRVSHVVLRAEVEGHGSLRRDRELPRFVKVQDSEEVFEADHGEKDRKDGKLHVHELEGDRVFELVSDVPVPASLRLEHLVRHREALLLQF